MAVTAHTDQYDGNVANDRSGRTSERRWLEAFLKRFYYAPLLAFWRAIEARALGDAPLPGPSLDIGGPDRALPAARPRHPPPHRRGGDNPPGPPPRHKRALPPLVGRGAPATPLPPPPLLTGV